MTSNLTKMTERRRTVEIRKPERTIPPPSPFNRRAKYRRETGAGFGAIHMSSHPVMKGVLITTRVFLRPSMSNSGPLVRQPARTEIKPRLAGQHNT
jgi:hypothetical protein